MGLVRQTYEFQLPRVVGKRHGINVCGERVGMLL
jgi:hypothetical protein